MRSSFGAGFPLFATAMYKNLGVGWASSTLGFLSIAFIPIPFVLYRVRFFLPSFLSSRWFFPFFFFFFFFMKLVYVSSSTGWGYRLTLERSTSMARRYGDVASLPDGTFRPSYRGVMIIIPPPPPPPPPRESIFILFHFIEKRAYRKKERAKMCLRD